MTGQDTDTAASTRAAGDDAGPALAINNIQVIYDEVILVLRGLSLTVPDRQIVALLGSNGAGKSTTMKAITGLLPTEHGEVTEGDIVYRGRDITRWDTADIVRAGISLVMEGRHVFEHLTVHENLMAGGFTRSGADQESVDRVYAYFPQLRERQSQRAGYLSGGEQQMLAIGRALMADPDLLMLDEPSLGLAPLLVEEIFGIIERLNSELHTTVLLVEQNARRALDIADHAYIMENGKVVLAGPAGELAENPDVKEFYLGVAESGGRRSYRDVKHHKRRKRWL
ncbi:MAG: ABC transporter ATP-binding protein [Actinobacteria bacterium]|nr:ABC transporter ATP-binding protein [Actinomycetota bacterium]